MAELSEEELRKTVETYLVKNCSIRATAKELQLARKTIRERLERAAILGMVPALENKRRDELYYRTKIKHLEAELTQLKHDNLQVNEVREFIYKISNLEPMAPDWLTDAIEKTELHANIGVPTAPLCDLHHSEIVDPKEVMGLNEFNIEICERRIRRWVERVCDLLHNHLIGEYPGIITPFLGDFISGLIHEELTATNEMPLLAGFHKLFSLLVWTVEQFHTAFNKVFIPCVPGNHGRIKPGRPQKKNYAVNNFDWHLYCLLEKWFEDESNIKFLVSSAQDVSWRIFDWRYRGTHGAQFRGGDGIIGPIGPIFRGDTRKRAQAADVMRDLKSDIGYDTLVLGHFHTTIMLKRFMVCGSVKGFDELAFERPFPYEPPQQALWLTHPRRGPTWHIEVQLDDDKSGKQKISEWVSWKEES